MTDEYEDIEGVEFNIKLANELIDLIDDVAPLLIPELGRLPYTSQWLAMGTLIARWADTLGDKRDEALDEINTFARGFVAGTPRK